MILHVTILHIYGILVVLQNETKQEYNNNFLYSMLILSLLSVII